MASKKSEPLVALTTREGGAAYVRPSCVVALCDTERLDGHTVVTTESAGRLVVRGEATEVAAALGLDVVELEEA